MIVEPADFYDVDLNEIFRGERRMEIEASDLFDFIKRMSLGISFGMVVVGTIMTSKYADRIVEWKVKHKIISE